MSSCKFRVMYFLYCILLFLVMTTLNIGTFNVNGCRCIKKRVTLFDYLRLKQADVILLQETHTDQQNQAQWISDWKGSVLLSHGTNLSAGVAILFSSRVGTQPVAVEIIPGRILRADIVFGDTNFSFFNVYAPNVGQERISFLKTLSDALLQCPQGNIVVLGGDFNCTINSYLDRNHDEPHHPSAESLKKIIKEHNLVDVWRESFPGARQYTWLKANSNHVSGARLDRFYVKKDYRGRFFSSTISPSFLSDHHYVSVVVSVCLSKSYKSHWRFNNRLLQDCTFFHSFNLFWNAWREERCNFQSLSQWWDVGKSQIKSFCQQYTEHSVGTLKARMKSLEQAILGQSSDCTHTNNSTFTDSVANDKLLLKNLLEEQGKTALLRTRFAQLNDMDAPTSFFFGLEKKPKEQKSFYQLKIPGGSVTTDQQEIQSYALSFYEDLYHSESCDDTATDELLCDLSKLTEEERSELDRPLSFGEISQAVQDLSSGKSPGLDGLTAEFFKSFWNVLGLDLFEVFLEGIDQGTLPLSCRRAILTLIPKKGDLGCLKNWRPVSLICVDFKILSKSLTNRLKKYMASVIHMDQTYCVPKRTIFDNLFLMRDMITVAKMHNLNIGFLSLDQEKAFDRVDHQYLFKTLEAFGFGPYFRSLIEMLYNEIYSMLKINGSLTRPFPVTRGIRQGCPLSGLLYAISIEPLLVSLRRQLNGFNIPNAPSVDSVKLTAYADDVTVVVKDSEDVTRLILALNKFQQASSARINWEKCSSLLLGDWQGAGPPRLPQQCKWARDGFRILGLYFGTKGYTEKNWEGLADKVILRIQKWQWILPHLSFRGRCLVINNLAASMLWHKFTVLDPPKELLLGVQKAFINFFWDGCHWLPPGVLYLPVAEGGQGLIHLESKILAMRLQSLQKLLYSSDLLPWVVFGLHIINKFGGLGLDKQLFLMQKTMVEKVYCLPFSFYPGVIQSWNCFKILRNEDEHYGFSEPLFFNPLFQSSTNVSSSLVTKFMNAGLSKVMDLIDFENGQWRTVHSIADQVGINSVRIVEGLVRYLKTSFPQTFLSFLSNGMQNGFISQNFPEFKVVPKDWESDVNSQTKLLKGHGALVFHCIGKKLLYHICCKSVHLEQLKQRPDTKWRSWLSIPDDFYPSWRLLYKPPISKRCGDIQWRILHCIIASNSFVSKINKDVLPECPFCNALDSVFHMFCECFRINPLFELLEKIIVRLGFTFTNTLFILGCKYKRSWQQQCILANFLIGQAKLVILKSHRCKNSGENVNIVTMFKSVVESRIVIEYTYYQHTNNVLYFEWKWCIREALVTVCESGNLLFNW